MLELRPYQEQAIQAVLSDFERPCSVIGVAATGAGKTICLLELANRILSEDPANRVLVIAHRRALIYQPQERVGQFWPHMLMDTGIVMASKNNPAKRLIIASVQTLANKARINHILSYGKVTHIIIDEAHRTGAKTYLDIIATCRDYNPALRVLGVTATPERADGKLSEVFDKESFVYGTRELIDMGYLVRPDIRGVFTDISVDDVKVTGSGSNRDYSSKQLSSVFETENCFDLVVQSHKEYAGDRPGIAFTCSVEGAYRLAEMFTEAGIPAIAVDGTTKQADEDEAIQGVKDGTYKMLINCQKFTEGFDLPMLEVCHLVRPLRQDGPWIQCVGRVLRLSPETGKETALVLDYLPQERTLELSLHKRASRMGQENVQKSRKSVDGEGGGLNPFIEDVPQVGIGNGIEYVVLDYFNQGNGSNKTWIESDQGWRIIGLGEGDDGIQRSLAVSPAAETMALWAIWKNPGERWNRAQVLDKGDCDTVLALSEEMVKKHGHESLTGKSAHWRSNSPKPGAERFGRNLGVYSDGMRAGELSDAINEKLATQALRRAGAF